MGLTCFSSQYTDTVEFLIHSYPGFVTVGSLPCESAQDRVIITFTHCYVQFCFWQKVSRMWQLIFSVLDGYLYKRGFCTVKSLIQSCVSHQWLILMFFPLLFPRLLWLNYFLRRGLSTLQNHCSTRFFHHGDCMKRSNHFIQNKIFSGDHVCSKQPSLARLEMDNAFVILLFN